MRWGSQLEVPFEKGELVQARFARGEPFIGVVRWIEGDRVVLWSGCHPCEWRLYSAPWWSGLTLVRSAIRGYPYERELSNFAWLLLRILSFPYRLRRRLCGFRR